MKIWFDRMSVIVRACLFILSLALCLNAWAAQSSPQAVLERAEGALTYWDVAAARTASEELLRMLPDSEEAQYIAGAVSFYEGDYGAAAKRFRNIRHLEKFEKGEGGMAALAEDLVKKKVYLRPTEGPQSIVLAAEGPDRVMEGFIAEDFPKIRGALKKALGFDPPEKIRIEIYPSADAFIAASPLTEKDVKTSGTIALCKYGRVLLTTPRSLLRGYPWMDTLSHETVHYFLSRRWGPFIPVWLHEGLAKSLEAAWRGEEPGRLSPMAENLLAEALETNNFVTFEEMHPSFAKLPSAERAQLAYAQVESLVAYLVKERGGWGNVTKVLDEMRQSDSPEKAFLAAYGVPLAKLQSEWRSWLGTQKLRRHKDLQVQTPQIRDAGDAKDESPDQDLAALMPAEQRDFLHLGDLLRQRGRASAALKEYEKAGKGVKNPAPLLASRLGRGYLEAGDLNQASTVMESSLAIYPESGLSWQILGEIRSRQKNWGAAETAYRKALHINPFNPMTHEQLGRVYAEQGNRAGERQVRESLRLLAKGE